MSLARVVAPPGFWPESAFDTLWAIGDLHGDLTTAIVCLRDLARVATKRGPGRWEWTAPPRTCVVVLGDVLDRCRKGTKLEPDTMGRNVGIGEQPNEEAMLLDLLVQLKQGAHTRQGALIFLLGNHELHNLADPTVHHAMQTCTEMYKGRYEERARSLRPGGDLHRRLLALEPLAMAQVGPWVFAHACLHESHVRSANRRRVHTLEYVNGNIGAAMRGDLNHRVADELSDTLIGKFGVCTYRGLSGDEACSRSEEFANTALKEYSKQNLQHALPVATHVVVGHSCQFSRDKRACGAAEHLVVEPGGASQGMFPFGRETLVGLGMRPNGPGAYGINATTDLTAFRLDVAQSRAFDTDGTWGADVSRADLEAARRPAVLRVLLSETKHPTATVRATKSLGYSREML